MKRLATGRCKREMEIVGEWSGWQGRLEKGEERGRGGMLVCFCGDGRRGWKEGCRRRCNSERGSECCVMANK